MSYDALIFDIDNTLFDEKSYFHQAFESIAARIAEEVDGDEQTILDQIIFEFEQKGSQYDNFFLYVAEYFGLEEPYHDEFYEIYKSVDAELELYDDAKDVIKWGRDNGYSLGVLTSGSAEAQRNKVETLGLEGLFDIVCIPRELGGGYEKPAPDAYQYVTTQLAVSPDRSVYIGDNPMSDFQGAKEIGMTTVRLRRGEFEDLTVNEGLIDYEITSHDEFWSLFPDE